MQTFDGLGCAIDFVVLSLQSIEKRWVTFSVGRMMP
jgi:hypothetical protein